MTLEQWRQNNDTDNAGTMTPEQRHAVHVKLRWNTHTCLLQNNVLCELLWNNHMFDSGTTIVLEHLLWNSHDAGTTNIALEQPWSKLWNTHYSGTAIKRSGTIKCNAPEHPCSGTATTLEQRQNALEQRRTMWVAVPAHFVAVLERFRVCTSVMCVVVDDKMKTCTHVKQDEAIRCGWLWRWSRTVLGV